MNLSTCSSCSMKREILVPVLLMQSTYWVDSYTGGEECIPLHTGGGMSQEFFNPVDNKRQLLSDNKRRWDSTFPAINKDKKKKRKEKRPLSFHLIYVLGHLVNLLVFLAPNSVFDRQERPVVILVYLFFITIPSLSELLLLWICYGASTQDSP